MAYAFECFAGRSVRSQQQSHAPIPRQRHPAPRRGTAPCPLGFLPEPLEGRWPASGMIAEAALDGVVVGNPDSAGELVAELSGDAEQQAAPSAFSDPSSGAPLLDLSPAPLAPEDDPLSAAGDPVAGQGTPETITTTNEASSGDSGSSDASGNTYYVSVGLGEPFVNPSEAATGIVSLFAFYVSAACSTGPHAASVTVNWMLSGVAIPHQDYDGSITDGTIDVSLDTSGSGVAFASIQAIDDDLDESSLENVDVWITGAHANPGGSVTITDSHESAFVVSGDYTMRFYVGGAYANQTVVDVSGDRMPSGKAVSVVVTQGGQPVEGVAVTLKDDGRGSNQVDVKIRAINYTTGAMTDVTQSTNTTNVNGLATFLLVGKSSPPDGSEFNQSYWKASLQNAEGRTQTSEKFTVLVVP